jgi:hypothetical protein
MSEGEWPTVVSGMAVHWRVATLPGSTRRAMPPGGLTWAGVVLGAGPKSWNMGQLREIPRKIELALRIGFGLK